MISISENRDPYIIGLMERAGLDPEQYRMISDRNTYLHVVDNHTGEILMIEKSTAETVKSPGALACSPGHKIKIN